MTSWSSPVAVSALAARLLALFVATTALPPPAHAAAADGATLADAVTQSRAALALLKKVGTAQAARDLMADPAWRANGMAVVMVDHAGRVLASSLNPAVIGQNKADLRDPNGKPWVREAIGISAARREGWVDYQFVDAQTHQRVSRVMFVKPWPAGSGFVGVALNRP